MVKFAKIDREDEEMKKKFRVEVKKRLFVMEKESLCPNERMEKLARGVIPQPVVIFEGRTEAYNNRLGAAKEGVEEEEEAEMESLEVAPEQRKMMLEGLYQECVTWYEKMRGKLAAL